MNSDELLQRIDTGDYRPALLDSCDQAAPRDENAQRIRYSQLLVFEQKGGGYRCPDLDQGGRQNRLGALAAALAEQLAQKQGSKSAALLKLPADADRSLSLAELRVFAAAQRIPGFLNELNENDTRALVRAHLAVRRPLAQALVHKKLQELMPDFQIAPDLGLSDALKPALTLPKAAALTERVLHYAMLADYEQSWQPLGYTRGELINGLSLAPGEELTLEYHFWDKSTAKREEELLEEREHRLDNKLTERDSLDVVREIAAQQGKKVTTGLKLSLPIPIQGTDGGNISGGVDSSMEQSLSNTLKTSMSKVRESVLQSVDSLKQQRKLRIEVARETGRDNKQTRQIANTNRGHVLHCRYFELLANYRVSTRVASLRPCLMLPLPIPQWSLRWVLAHEAELSRVLLSEAVRPGFVAAKRLGLREQVEALRAAAAAQRGNTGARETELGLLRDKVKAALTTMRHDTELLRDALAEPAVRAAAVFGPIALTIALHIALGSLLALRRALAFAVLRGDTRSHNALLRFEAEPASTKAGDAFARLFADLRVYPEASNDQQVESGLRAAGFGAAIAAVLLAVANLAEAISDDAGLQEHLGAARQTLNAGGSGQGYAASSDGDASAIREDSAELWADAEATVEFQRLRDHLQENAIHYAQALWLMRHPDDRALRLRAFAPYGDLLSPEVVGFFADRVAHPIQNFAAFAHDLDLASLISGVQKQLAPAPDCLLTLPTQGTELITQLGACDACEDFIQDNRRIEIERLQAQADQQKFEARRRQLRLEQSPPVLDDFDELSSAPLLLSAQAQADQVAAP